MIDPKMTLLDYIGTPPAKVWQKDKNNLEKIVLTFQLISKLKTNSG
jgi:hypothetical protein